MAMAQCVLALHQLLDSEQTASVNLLAYALVLGYDISENSVVYLETLFLLHDANPPNPELVDDQAVVAFLAPHVVAVELALIVEHHVEMFF